MTQKVVLVLSDGLRYDTAVAQMGFLGHLVEAGLAKLYKVIAELPTWSRPLYETIHTGLPVSEHGVVANGVARRSIKPNVFQTAVDTGRTTAAAAYYWFSELYNRSPYDPIDDCEVDDDSLPIQHGRFYMKDDYPDADLLALAGNLVRKFTPDYLLVHTSGMDYLGEIHGADSSEYRNQAVRQDAIMARLIVEWRDLGYTVLVTADHGMGDDYLHGGTTPGVREVPLYFITSQMPAASDEDGIVSQLRLAPTLCRLLDIPIPKTMKGTPLV